MSRNRHTLSIDLQLDPDEHPAEGAVWDLLVRRVMQSVAELAADPRLTGNPRLDDLLDPLSYNVEITDTYGVDPAVLDIREGLHVTFNRSSGTSWGIPTDHPAMQGTVEDEPRNSGQGIAVEIRSDGIVYYAPLDSITL